jgi:hypothetical protein
MFFMRTDSHRELLNEIIRLGLVSCTKLEDGGWTKITDRATLYMAVINELIADASREGVTTVDGCYDTIEAINCVDATEEDECEREECDQLGGGCTCEDCTKQILAVQSL